MMKIKDLPITPVDSLSPIPLYYQIEADLKQLIRSEKLPAGALLPPEMDLCRAYGVGRHTMRVAIGRLVTENLVERFAGRGTFVKQPADRRKFLLDRSFTRQMAEMGLKATSKVLDCSPGEVDESAPAPLHRYMGHACLNLIRLRLGDGHPIGLQFATILTEHCPDLEENDFMEALEAIVHSGMDGVIVNNTTLARAGLRSANAAEQGGLSGRPLCARSQALTERAVRALDGRLPVVASGGMLTPADVLARLDAGAALVQLYTGLIYNGPGLPRACLRAIQQTQAAR